MSKSMHNIVMSIGYSVVIGTLAKCAWIDFHGEGPDEFTRRFLWAIGILNLMTLIELRCAKRERDGGAA